MRLATAFLRASRRRQPPDRFVLAVAHRAQAEARIYTGRLKAACAAYRQAAALAAQAGDDRLRGQILVGYVGTLLAMGREPETRPLIRRARTLLTKTGDHDYLRRLLINIASGYYHREQYSSAYEAYAEALRLMETAGQRDSVWASLVLNYGVAGTHLSRIEEARERFRQAREYGERNGLDHLASQAAFNLGALEAMRGDYRRALKYLSAAEEIFGRQGARDLLAAGWLEQAQIYLDLAMPVEARDLAARARSAFAEEGMLLDAHLSLLAEARSLLLLGLPSEAASRLQESDEFYRRRTIQPRRAQVLILLARALHDLGSAMEARAAARSAVQIATRYDMRAAEAEARCFLAEIQIQAGAVSGAKHSLNPVARLLARLPVQNQLDYWASAARLADRLGRESLALRRYERAAVCLEAHRALIPGIDLRAAALSLKADVYHQQIRILARRSKPSVARILDLMEAARGRSFHEMLERAAPAVREEVTRMRAELSSVTRRLEVADAAALQDAASRANVSRLRSRARELERAIAARIRNLEEAHVGSARLASATADRIARGLRPDEALIEYLVAGDSIVAVVLRPQSRSVRVLAMPSSAVTATLAHLRLQLDAFAAAGGRPPGNLDFLRRHAEFRLRNLYEGLLAPLRSDIGTARRLIIVAHGILHTVPFECLHTGGGYMDDVWEIRRCPTGSFFADRRATRRRTLRRSAVIVAGTQASAPRIVAEAKRVARKWPREARSLLIDPEPGRVLRALEETDLLHLSAHGVFRRDNPLFSTLHLGRSVLFVADLLEARAQASLVVLSACSSGEVASEPGDSLIGVAHAFLAAGVQTLVAALWKIEDEASSEWMDAFHDAYLSPKSAAAALRSTNRTLRANWPHPFYWGGFCVLGA